jgi:hypothetical protein
LIGVILKREGKKAILAMSRNSREKRRDEGNEIGQREGGTRKGGYRFLPHLPDGDELLPTPEGSSCGGEES